MKKSDLFWVGVASAIFGGAIVLAGYTYLIQSKKIMGIESRLMQPISSGG